MKYDTLQNKELAKIVKNFNAKINRLIKKGVSADALPQKISVKGLKADITNKRDYNRIVRTYSKFTIRGAEKIIKNKKGVSYTKWQRDKLKNDVRRLNYARSKALAKAAPSTYKGTMGSIRERNLSPKKVNLQNISSQKALQNVVQGIEKQLRANYAEEKARQYKSNYMQSWYNAFGLEGMDLLQRIAAIPNDVFYNMYYDDPRLQIDFVYDFYELRGKLSQIDIALSKQGY